jgi:phage terminase large subunit-like protein
MPRSAPMPPGVALAFAWAKGVARRKTPAGRLARLAVERWERDHAQAKAGGPWEFRADLAEHGIRFAGLMPNIKGPLAGQPIEVLGWQAFVYANLLGWVERGTKTRRFRQGIVYVPRGNGKTTIAAPLALYLTFFEEAGGAEGYAAAVTRDQARILFDVAREMVRRSPALRAKGVAPNANTIARVSSASSFRPVSSDAKALDGLNVQCAVLDEIASHRTSEVYDVMLTAMGKRKHPLLLAISTATGNSQGIGRQLWDYATRVLEETQQDERLFGLIFAADPEDDPWAEATWIKANPSWGVAVRPDAIASIMRQARNNPAQESAAKTRHLNIWVGADEALFSMRAWRECGDTGLRLEDFAGEEAYIGLDLASRTDLAALAIVIPRTDPDTGKAHYTAFARCFLNDAAVSDARLPAYPGWAADGTLIVTPGNETDFGEIEEEIRRIAGLLRVASIGFDPWQSTQMAQRLGAEGLAVAEFRATTQNFSPAIVELDAAMRSGRLRHDGNPALEWCMGNVIGKPDRRGNQYPTKARPENKIDAAVALMMAIGRAMSRDESAGDILDFLRNPVIA